MTLVPRMTFGNVKGVESMTFALGRGVQPSVCSFSVPVGVELDRVPKTLTISDGVRSVQFTQCLLQHAVPSTDGSGLSSQSCAVADRRWKWKYGQVSGKYNVRKRGQILEETKRTPRELAELCFEAMGERKYDISKMPNDILPFIEWDMETPDAALDQLCQLVNSHVCLRSDDTAAIYRDGEGNDLPNIPSSSFSDGLDFGEKPGMCGVASAPFQWQVDLTLTPVGLDKDDIIKPIKDLSYMPKGGWGDVEVTEMEDVEKKYRKIAKETVWRWYLIGRPESMETMPMTKEKLRSVDQFFPLLDHQLDYTRLSQEQKIGRKNEGRIDAAAIARKPRQVFGVFYDEDGTGTDNVEEFTDDLSPLNNELKTANLSVYSKSFQVDNERMLVIFSDPVYRFRDGMATSADIRLRTAVNLRHIVTRALYRWTKTQKVPGGIDASIIKWTTRNDVIPEWNPITKEKPDNLQQVARELQYYMENALERYAPKSPASGTYPMLVPYSPDGRIAEVIYSIDGEGFISTSVNREVESLYNLQSYAEGRRELSRSAILAKLARQLAAQEPEEDQP